jgi:hypothetical protein
MEDPFRELSHLLHVVLLTATQRNGAYTNKQVHLLDNALHNYNPKNRQSFVILIRALMDSIPYLEKKNIDLNKLMKCMNHLAKKHSMPSIEWHTIVAHHKKSQKFQFEPQVAHEKSLFRWLSLQIGKPFGQLGHLEKTQTLIDQRNQSGFIKKLSLYLKKHPDFLFELMMKSEKNFIKIVGTRLNLYVTDEQLAEAIVHHRNKLIQNNNPSHVPENEHFIEELNRLLTNGRSFATLCRNAKAQKILMEILYIPPHQSFS